MTLSSKPSLGPTEWLLLLMLAAIWGGSFFFNTILLHQLHPLTIVFARVALAAVALNFLLIALHQPLYKYSQLFPSFLLLGALNNLLPFFFLTWSQTRITGGLAAILNATTPLWTVLLAHLLTRDERLTGNRIAGVVIGILGVVCIIGRHAILGLSSNVAAQIACLCAAICYAFAGIFARRFRGVPSLVLATGQVTASTLLALPLVIFIDKPWHLGTPSGQTIAAILALGLLSTALAYVLYFRILRAAGATNVVLVTFLVPISALLLGRFILKESIHLRELAGMLCIGMGLAVMDGRLLRLLFPGAKAKSIAVAHTSEGEVGRAHPTDGG